jgi:gluconate 2-dehydrogenase gamma chain
MTLPVVDPLHLDRHAWATLEAAMARIIPTDDTPGAREAGTIVWLDRYLSGIGYIHAMPDGSGFVTLTGKDAEAWTARIAALRERYRAGVEALDRLGRERSGCDFHRLEGPDQDAVLAELERDGSLERKRTQAAVGEDELPFFALLVLHTRQAFYSDPVYGGNRDQLGWRLIGFHGPASMADALHDRYTTDAFLA